ncbi:hypothetical protein NO932_00195 [Pelagibacterium sp. 26DY04]|uniref:hypothetical protein n=1 Tax=unclassified Pelagibacterium TaxID=2623280 RepID=UPI0028164552|nr:MULTISPECIES: hypothetical protein [unclassified Pelagibacterium]WMT87058.1 hypothetical protein NO932_00195 [Pelagibacterium sp. 26DY04]WMT92223.1 hypothetical protein NO934_08205 [Pelagibacterium sp. H642]
MNAQEIIDTTKEDFVTIIAPSMAEVMASFKSQGLAERDYSIVHRAGKHSFTMAGGQKLFDGAQMVAATFARRG